MKSLLLVSCFVLNAVAFSGCNSGGLLSFDDSEPMRGDELIASGHLESPVAESVVEEPTPLDEETIRQKYLNAVPLSELDEPIRLLDRQPLVFPDDLRTRNYSGQTTLLVTIDEFGRVVACQIDSADHDEVAEEIRAQIAERKFSIPMLKGQPVTAFGRLPVPYRIGQGNLMKIIRQSEWESSPRK